MQALLKYIIPLFIFSIANAQDEKPKRLEINGYISSMQSVMFDSINKNWTQDNYLNNRINAKWFMSDKITAVAEMRNRFIFGESIEVNPSAYANGYEKDNGLADMTFNWTKGNSYLLNTNIDRLYVAYQHQKLNLTIGRQRINWGQTMAWNPNDIFNAYSFFDFDYIERPGSDAVRLQFFNTPTSVIEFAAKMDADENITTAGLYRFNQWGSDIQILAGVFSSSDYVIGGGFSGNIKSIAVRSEASYLHPIDNFADTSGMLLLSIQTDYTFANSLTIQGEYLFNQNPGIDFQRFASTYNTQLNIKSLSFVKHNLFASVSYPFSPLVSGTLSGMVFPQLNGFYVGPSLSISLANNIDFSFIAQGFSLEQNNTRMALILGFIRLKVSF